MSALRSSNLWYWLLVLNILITVTPDHQHGNLRIWLFVTLYMQSVLTCRLKLWRDEICVAHTYWVKLWFDKIVFKYIGPTRKSGTKKVWRLNVWRQTFGRVKTCVAYCDESVVCVGEVGEYQNTGVFEWHVASPQTCHQLLNLAENSIPSTSALCVLYLYLYFVTRHAAPGTSILDNHLISG